MNEDIQRTEIICLLDRSGSMGGLEQDTIGGYNSLISRHGALEGEARITTVLFDDRYEVIHDHQSCAEALLSDADYFVRGSTALYDAAGRAICDTKRRLAAEGPQRSQVIFVIITDGYENSSREFDAQRIHQLITEQKQLHHWQFLFFGANIEVQTVGTQLGIDTQDLHSFEASSSGVRGMMHDVVCETTRMRYRDPDHT